MILESPKSNTAMIYIENYTGPNSSLRLFMIKKGPISTIITKNTLNPPRVVLRAFNHQKKRAIRELGPFFIRHSSLVSWSSGRISSNSQCDGLFLLHPTAKFA